MAKIAKVVPEVTLTFAEINAGKKNQIRTFRLFESVPEVLGEAQYQDIGKWVTDDGLKFATAEDVQDYFLKRRAKEQKAKVLKAGEYHVNAASVTVQHDRVLIKTADGKDLVIYTRT